MFRPTSASEFKTYSLNKSYIQRKKKEIEQCKPKANLISPQVSDFKAHYKTMQGSAFKGHTNFTPSALDYLPYP